MSCQRSNGKEATHIKDLKSDNLSLDKALGIHWDVERNTIDFSHGLFVFSHILTRPKLRAERNTSSKIELKLSPTPLSVSEVTEAEKRVVKQRFRTVKGVSSVKRVLSKCHVCRRYNATLGEQVTAQLSMVQVSSDSHRIIYSFAA
ncbi:hypothetical protein pdam_00003866, partial [Pocillopora damicornis]